MTRFVLVMMLCAALATCSQAPTLLEEVRLLGELRVLTSESPTTYYQGPRGPMGPEFELARGFAQFLGVQLSMVSVEKFHELLPRVEIGRAHMAAAGLTVTEERSRRVIFGPAYQTVTQHVVYRRGTRRPRSVADLVGKKIEVIAASSFAERLRALQQDTKEFVFTENPAADVAELLVAVNERKIDYTVADSNQFEIYRNLAPEIRPGLLLADRDDLAWAFPRRDHSLIREAARYIAFINESGELKRILDRYYGHTGRFDYVGTRRLIRDYEAKLPEYRPMFEEAAEKIGMDWRLLAAIGYQESLWDPDAVSPTGVRGIMMLTEKTANYIGVDDRVDPAQSIAGGADYISRMKARFAEVREPDRTWFALAAYNIGYAHVQDARALARDQGLNADTWVHVREHFEKLSQARWYRQTRHGYAPGWEPVRYVENVRNYYDILVWLTLEEAGEPETEPDGDEPLTVAGAWRAGTSATG
ncbi:MAG: membrane-bound lytic murein transglycosylase MltF [Chromatiales bacterium]|nr:MAG: membrane-bound lytic murein transglycosylase MltF [Chromatiales bacterium]